MLRLFSSLIVFVAPLALPAQNNPEAVVVAEATKKLNDYAHDSLEGGYPDRAEEVWREVLAEYDTDDAVARKALGFKPVGKSWAMDPEFRYPEFGEATLAKAKALRKRWEKLAEELAQTHLRCAEALAAAGNAERANYHYDRVLRFQPGQAKAAAARGVASFDGVFGSQTEIAMLKRVRTVRRAVAQVSAMPIKVTPTTEVHEVIKRSGVAVVGFAGPNVTCYGNVDPGIVEEAVRVAERSLALCKAVFEGHASYGTGALTAIQVFCADDAAWLKILEANTGLLGDSSLDFLRERKPATTLFHGSTRIGFVRALGSAPSAYDMAARWIAQSFCQFKCDALMEGIGHTIVGLLLGQNLSFIIGEDKEKGTVASRTRKLKSETPDIQVWQELAIDTAWENTSMPAAQLAFLKAAAFPTEGRIKAWSFCHFLLLRDPELLRKLDDAPGEKVRTPYELRHMFTAAAGIHIDALDQEWRAFWTKDTPLLRAVRGGEIPALEGVSEDAFAWVDALNLTRKNLMQAVRGLKFETVHWSETYTEDCKLHADYLEKHKSERGLGKEDTQDLGKDGATPRGKAFARGAVIQFAPKPDKALDGWMLWPGYRHIVLDPRLQLVGAYATKALLVMDATRGIVPTENAIGVRYPFNGEKAVPYEVDVAELGPEVRRLLDANGGKASKKVGLPLTFHIYGDARGGMSPAPNHYTCEVTQGNDRVPGVVHVPHDNGSRRTHGRGLAVFYPLQPLKRGTEYRFQWLAGGKAEGDAHTFTTK